MLFINSWKTTFLLNNIYKSGLYLTGNTLRLHYKAQPVNARAHTVTYWRGDTEHYINPLKTEFLLNDLYKSSPYLTGNTLRLRCKAQLVNARADAITYWRGDTERYINPLKTEFLLNDVYKSSPYLTGKTLRLRYKAQPVNAV
jgi:hypothetical protein